MSVKKCKNCGYENDSTMNFCLECGIQLIGNPLSAAKTVILPATGQSASTVVLPKKKSRKYFWIFGGLASLLILLLLGFIAALYLARKIGQSNASVKMPTPAISPTRKSSPTPRKPANINSSNASVEPPETEETTTAPDPSFTPPAKPTAQGVFNVKANKNWQLSNLDVVPNEKFVLLAVGSVDLEEIKKVVSPEGVADKKYQTRRLFPEFPAGALLMRTRYADGKYSKISAVTSKNSTGIWQNAPDERGRLEFCINDNAPDSNDGEFVVSLAIIEK